MSGLISCGDFLPEVAASCFTTIPDNEGDDLTRRTAERNPDPPFAAFLEHKGPQLVEFQFGAL